jgi:hypothetical protein
MPLSHPKKEQHMQAFVNHSNMQNRLKPVRILNGNTGSKNAQPSFAIADTETDIVCVESLGDRQFELTLDLRPYIESRVDEEIKKTMANLGKIIDDMADELYMDQDAPHATA